MIRVARRPEPAEFDKTVRKPGRKFLAGCPNPTQKQWRTHSYWRRILHSLHSAYGGICSYSCHWIPYDTGADTVEHFKPKTKHPKDAYEWRNYRLVCQLLNSRKGDEEEILDPFVIQTGWFIIEFPTLIVKPAPGLRKALHERVKKTRDVLGLNDDATCMMMRQQFVTDYCLEEINFVHLEKRAPFLALQMKEQGYDRLAEIRNIMNISPDDE
ncbi:MAG: hypothetical protein HYS12_10030 [Planctomycetes bacterium]|nr:hypothetical protein [Planctomycetota bacterium]